LLEGAYVRLKGRALIAMEFSEVGDGDMAVGVGGPAGGPVGESTGGGIDGFPAATQKKFTKIY
jgi:hypothetical protein